jgi:hypothetical protein
VNVVVGFPHPDALSVIVYVPVGVADPVRMYTVSVYVGR